MSAQIVRQMSIVACLAGLATATVFFLAMWNGTPTPPWMPGLIAMVGGYELVQWGHSLWYNRHRRKS